MDSQLAITTLKTNLNSNLTDLYTIAGGDARAQWIYYNEPISSPKYPIIEMKVVDNPEEPISIGPNFTVSEFVIINLWIYSKNGFKVTVSGTEYLNASLIEYLKVQIKETIKSQFSNLHDSGIIVRTINSAPIDYEPTTQLYFSFVTVKIWFFKQ